MFAKNLKYLRQQYNMEQLDLAQRLGRKSSSSISEWEKGKYTPKAGTLSDIAEIFNVTLSDLMNTDLSVTSNPTLAQINSTAEKLTQPRQQIVLKTAKKQLKEQQAENSNVIQIKETANYDIKLQLYPYKVQERLSAGTGYNYDGGGSSDIVYYDEELDYDVASYVWGDSMEPKYENGEVVLIRECGFDYNGGVYAVDWDGQSYIKKVYKEDDGLRLVSINNKYSDKFAPISEEPRIIGKVIDSFMPIEMY